MRHFFAFLVLASVKTLSTILFKCKVKWITNAPDYPWTNDIRHIVFLNHTSLYEPIFLQVVSYRYLWELSARANVPAADITLNRPIVGLFWKLMIPNIVPVTRKSDSSWENYVKNIRHDDVVLIAPEGRMKRPNGLDKYGKKMTVRGGVADIIMSMNDGKMLLAFSGGLHHVQAPGQHVPNFFRKIQMNIAYLDIADYKKKFPSDPRAQKLAIVQDLQNRLENDCPNMNISKSSLREEQTGT
jgi:1-acyl-sn-glycerol-3-phosphate acyltransferase